uniref:Uncharacterized protein n=1 Tax=Timema genevievae TaxID=629358 RepID=A0A7R9K1R8_TIMGE|nr:unnamed protein product [Timema genevievae]
MSDESLNENLIDRLRQFASKPSDNVEAVRSAAARLHSRTASQVWFPDYLPYIPLPLTTPFRTLQLELMGPATESFCSFFSSYRSLAWKRDEYRNAKLVLGKRNYIASARGVSATN